MEVREASACYLLKKDSVCPPGYKQTEVGVIPKDWEVKQFGDIVMPRRQRIDPRKSNIQEFCIELEHIGSATGTLLGSTSTGEQSSLKSIFRASDVLFGKLRAYLRKYWQADRPGVCSTEIWVLSPIETLFSSAFLFQIVQTDKFIEASSSSYGTHMPRSDWNVVKKYALPFPPTKAEQEAIAEALSDADTFIESLQQLIAKKRQVKQGAMQELLTGQKRLLGFEAKPGYKQTEMGLIPEDWVIKTIDEISIVGRGRVISHNEIAQSRDPQYPVYSSQTSNDGVMGYLDTFEFAGEYITWTTDGANAGTVFYRNGQFNCTNVCGTIKAKSDNHLFVAKILGRIARFHVSWHLGNPKLMNDAMKKVKIPLPSNTEEQTAIATILSDMDAEIAALKEKLAKARAIKQGMMQELLTGRIRLV